LSSPPKVIEEAPTVARIPAASRPLHFQANVARWRSNEPSRVAISSPAIGGSIRPYSFGFVMTDEPTDLGD
jgi:acyl transferase domain-containing protein